MLSVDGSLGFLNYIYGCRTSVYHVILHGIPEIVQLEAPDSTMVLVNVVIAGVWNLWLMSLKKTCLADRAAY